LAVPCRGHREVRSRTRAARRHHRLRAREGHVVRWSHCTIHTRRGRTRPAEARLEPAALAAYGYGDCTRRAISAATNAAIYSRRVVSVVCGQRSGDREATCARPSATAGSSVCVQQVRHTPPREETHAGECKLCAAATEPIQRPLGEHVPLHGAQRQQRERRAATRGGSSLPCCARPSCAMEKKPWTKDAVVGAPGAKVPPESAAPSVTALARPAARGPLFHA
jgi:hypothetical protein